jgi:hypothetical protein
VTPIAVAIHPEGENAVFSNATTHVMIEDEAGGGFIVLKQFDDNAQPGELRFDADELRMVSQQAQKLLAAYEKSCK